MPSKDRVLAEAMEELHVGIDVGNAPTEEAAMRFWRKSRWPKPGDNHGTGIWDAAKIAEEAGEVVAAVIKIEEGRADIEVLRDELGDLLIAASVIAGRHGWTLAELRSARWVEVRER